MAKTFCIIGPQAEGIKIEVDPLTAVSIIANIQLATRHRENLGPSRQLAESFAKQLGLVVCGLRPDLADAIQAGWDPQYDFDATGYGDQFKRKPNG